MVSKIRSKPAWIAIAVSVVIGLLTFAASWGSTATKASTAVAKAEAVDSVVRTLQINDAVKAEKLDAILMALETQKTELTAIKTAIQDHVKEDKKRGK